MGSKGENRRRLREIRCFKNCVFLRKVNDHHYFCANPKGSTYWKRNSYCYRKRRTYKKYRIPDLNFANSRPNYEKKETYYKNK